MQAIIMAAGKGSRIEHLTDGKPKSFLEIKGKKLIEYNLEILRKIGVNNIIIVTGYKDSAFIELTKDMPDIILKYNPFYSLVNVLGSFYMGMEELHEDFIYLHADTICEKSIFDELTQFKADINLPIEYKICDDEAMKIKNKDGKVSLITKKMDISEAEGEFIGIASIKKEVIPILKEKTKKILSDGRFTEYFEAAIQKIIDEESFVSVKAFDIKNAFWAEIDFEEDYKRTVENIK